MIVHDASALTGPVRVAIDPPMGGPDAVIHFSFGSGKTWWIADLTTPIHDALVAEREDQDVYEVVTHAGELARIIRHDPHGHVVRTVERTP